MTTKLINNNPFIFLIDYSLGDELPNEVKIGNCDMTDPILHNKLDAILKDEIATKYYYKQLAPVLTTLLFAALLQKGELTASEAQQHKRKLNPAKLLERFGITAQQYNSLISGKGTAQVWWTYKRVFERNDINFDKFLYSQKLINRTFEDLKNRNSQSTDIDVLAD